MATGHPRDVSLFHGAFSTGQTRSELKAQVEKMRAQAYHKLGDMPKAHSHLAEAQKLMALASGDAVERVEASKSAAAAVGGSSGYGGAVGSTAPVATSAASTSKPAAEDLGAAGDIRQLWAADVAEEAPLNKYRYTDDGATASLILDLNDHLGLGDEASTLVDSLRQFKVTCTAESVTIRLRIRCPPTRKGYTVRELKMHLEPLALEIVPEDTVPRLKGREGKRRLEVKLFKRKADQKWFGDFVKSGEKPKKAEGESDAAKKAPTVAAAAPKGSQLNPLTPEELARLPRPSGGNCDNRPSSWVSGKAETKPSACAEIAQKPPACAEAAPAGGLEEMD